MKRSTTVLMGIALGTAAVLAGTASAHDKRPRLERFEARLSGLNEDPLALSTTGSGKLKATLNEAGTELSWELSYEGTEGTVAQAHIHLGGPRQSGGIMVFFCTNLGNGPAGTPACPASGTITGTFTAANVIGPAGQGVTAGQFEEFLTALRAGTAYTNVHSSLYPGGEIRGQVHRDFF